MYVNTSAEVKAETDYCCTSSNAVKVVEHIFREHGDDTEVLFGPDMWLGAYVARETGRRLRGLGRRVPRARRHPPGRHQRAARDASPDADFLIHPECGCTTQVMEYVAAGDVAAEGTHFLSTEGMMRHARESEQRHDDRRDRDRHPAPHGAAEPRTSASSRRTAAAVCNYMKMITLPKLRDSLRDMKYEVSVPPAVADRARVPIERMVGIG